jgi:hypothetical protein
MGQNLLFTIILQLGFTYKIYLKFIFLHFNPVDYIKSCTWNIENTHQSCRLYKEVHLKH